MYKLLLNREIYLQLVQECIPQSRQSLWIVTADIKDMYIEYGNAFAPFLQLLADMIDRGVAIRLIHAKEPGPRFRQEYDRFEQLIESDLFERVLCPRVHTKAVIIDHKLAFIGSPNLTGAGMGGKHEDKHNFEAGFLFNNVGEIKRLSEWVERLCKGEYCTSCRRVEHCPDPICDNI